MKAIEKQDYEANLFALALLMPEDVLRSEIRKHGGLDLSDDRAFDDVAKKFKVTRTALAMRLRMIETVAERA